MTNKSIPPEFLRIILDQPLPIETGNELQAFLRKVYRATLELNKQEPQNVRNK